MRSIPRNFLQARRTSSPPAARPFHPSIRTSSLQAFRADGAAGSVDTESAALPTRRNALWLPRISCSLRICVQSSRRCGVGSEEGCFSSALQISAWRVQSLALSQIEYSLSISCRGLLVLWMRLRWNSGVAVGARISGRAEMAIWRCSLRNNTSTVN